MPDFPTLTDTETWTDDALGQLIAAAYREAERRHTLRSSAAQAEQTAVRWREAYESALPPLAEGEHRPWVQPLGAHDVYQLGAIVAHDGHVYESLHPANAWEPGTDDRLWKDVTDTAPAPEPTPSAERWEPGQAVAVGALREYQGTVYAAIQPHTTQAGWEPANVPALWKLA